MAMYIHLWCSTHQNQQCDGWHCWIAPDCVFQSRQMPGRIHYGMYTLSHRMGGWCWPCQYRRMSQSIEHHSLRQSPIAHYVRTQYLRVVHTLMKRTRHQSVNKSSSIYSNMSYLNATSLNKNGWMKQPKFWCGSLMMDSNHCPLSQQSHILLLDPCPCTLWLYTHSS